MKEDRLEVQTKKRRRSDTGRLRLGKRDLTGMLWVGEQGTMRIDQLANLFGLLDKRYVSPDAARKTVARWLDHGWANSQIILQGHPAFVWLTPAGMKNVGLDFPAVEPALATIHHTADVAGIRIGIFKEVPSASWRSERAIRSVMQGRAQGQTVPHIPDAEVRLTDGRLIAIERERTAKTIERTKRIQLGLLSRRYDYDHASDEPSTLIRPRYDTVCYYATPEVVSVVQQARSQLPTDMQTRLQVMSWQ